MCLRAVFRATAVSLVLGLVSGCVSHKYRNPEFAAAHAKRNSNPAATPSADVQDADAFGPEPSELDFADNTHPLSSRATAAAAPAAKTSAPNDFLAGRNAEDSGDLESAQQLYRRVLEDHPTHAYAHHRLGVVSDKLRQFDEAERHYQAALNYLSPQDRRNISLVFSDLGYSYLLQGDFTRSERALNNALAFDQNSRIALRNLALLHGYRGNFARAYETFARAGSETEARAELDRLFPNWQNQMVAQSAPPIAASPASASPAAMNTAVPTPSAINANTTNPATAAAISPVAGITGSPSSTFPTSAAPSQVAYPEQTTAATEQIVARPVHTTPPTPASQTPVAVGQIPTPTQPSLQAPPPSRRHRESPQPTGMNDSPSIAAAEPQMSASTGVTPATYQQELHQMVEGTPMSAQPVVSTPPEIKISVDSIQSGPNPAASQAALILGGAVGPGGMFPTTQIEIPSPPSTSPQTDPAAQTPHTTQGAAQPVIQQISAEFPTISVSTSGAPIHVPANTAATRPASPPVHPTSHATNEYPGNTQAAQPVSGSTQYSRQYFPEPASQPVSQPNAPSAATSPAASHMFPTSQKR